MNSWKPKFVIVVTSLWMFGMGMTAEAGNEPTMAKKTEYAGFSLGMSEAQVESIIQQRHGFKQFFDKDAGLLDGNPISTEKTEEIFKNGRRPGEAHYPCVVTHYPKKASAETPVITKYFCLYAPLDTELLYFSLSLAHDHLFLMESQFQMRMTEDTYNALLSSFDGGFHRVDKKTLDLPTTQLDPINGNMASFQFDTVLLWESKADAAQAIIIDVEAKHQAFYLRVLDTQARTLLGKELRQFQKAGPVATY